MGTPPSPTGPPDAHIGKKAVEMGLITANQLAEVLLQMSQPGVPPQTLLATTLITRGLLTEAQVGVISDLAKGGPPKRVGKYHIVRELGRGGMGVVYEAQDPALGRRVALKTLLTGFNTPEETRRLDEERFLREARLCANLPKHPHIVGVYEAGAEDEQRFIAMEFIEGLQFSDWRKKSSAPRKQQIAVLRDVALAVDHAHRHGVIHRDLKPANILVDPSNRPHVTDFGLAKRGTAAPTLALTVTGEVMGTPAYMSPEQAEGRKEIDHRADIWALGVMLYEILTGRVPFEAETPLKLIMKTVNEPVKPPSEFIRTANSDPRIEAICMKALAKDPQARYASAKAFADDLTRWIKGEKPPSVARQPAASSSKTGLYVGIGAGAAVVIAIVIAVVVGSSGPSFDADLYISQGLQLLAQDKPMEALVKFGRVLEEDPGNRAAAAGKKEAERKLKGGVPPTPAPADPDAMRREAWKKELDELDALVATLRKAENFGTAREMLAQAEKRHEGAEWTGEVAKRSAALKKAVQDLFGQVAAEAEAARKTDLSLEVEARRTRVKQWNWPGLAKDLDDALAKVKPPAPPPPPPPPPDATWPGLAELAPFLGSGNAVHSISMSQDGKQVLSASFEGTVRMWDAATRAAVKIHEGDRATSVALSTDGKWIAAGYHDGKARIWDTAKMQLRVIAGHGTQVLGLAFTPDSKLLLTASTDTLVKTWDPATGTMKHQFDGHARGAMCAAIDPAGKLAAVGSAWNDIRLWDLSGGREHRTIGIGNNTCTKIAFATDGKSVFAGVKNDLIQYDLLTGTPRVFGSHADFVRGLSVSPNGRWVATTSGGDGIKIWDASSAALVETIPHANSYYAVAFSPRGDLLLGGCGNFELRLWELKGRK